jgi:flagellar basal body-associated protein FliL
MQCAIPVVVLLLSLQALVSGQESCEKTFRCSNIASGWENYPVLAAPQNYTTPDGYCLYGHSAVDGDCTKDECGVNQEPCACLSKEQAQGEHSSRRRMLQIGSAAALIALSTIIAFAWMVRTHATVKKGESTRTPYAIASIFTTMLCFFGGLAALILGIKEQTQDEHRRMLQIGSAAVLIALSTIIAVAWMVRAHARAKEGESNRTPCTIVVILATMLCFFGGLTALIIGVVGDFSEYRICGQNLEKDIFV